MAGRWDRTGSAAIASVVLVGLAMSGCTSASQQSKDNAALAPHYVQQVCVGLAEIADGLANKTMTASDVSAKLDVMKSNADEAAGLDPSNQADQALDTAVQQLRAAIANNDTTGMNDALTTVQQSCPH